MKGISQQKIDASYWENISLDDSDIEFIYNHLLELENPLTPQELALSLINERISQLKADLAKNESNLGILYLPEKHFQSGDTLVFPAMDWQKGKVTHSRQGVNPEIGDFNVITIEFDDRTQRLFAMDLSDHVLNHSLTAYPEDENLDTEFIHNKYGKLITQKLVTILESNEDLVKIAGRWFPRSLLVDINIGHLNLAEAILEEANGGPLLTSDIVAQIELPKNINPKLIEFSLNLALEEDPRFDEVGPAGETLWFLHRFEPEDVKNPPIYLRWTYGIDNDTQDKELQELENLVVDELEPCFEPDCEASTISFALIFPHWRVGSIPLTNALKHFFPTAYEAPRIRFQFQDKESGDFYPGWVVRSHNYVVGLREWYEKTGLIPGSLIRVEKGNQPGDVIVSAEKRRQNREWIRTILVGKDEVPVFAMVKQLVNAAFDERMAVAIPDLESVDKLWQKSQKGKQLTIHQAILTTMKELARLNPQGHVHAQELYAAANVTRRCSPRQVISALKSSSSVSYLGDLYFKVNEEEGGNSK